VTNKNSASFRNFFLKSPVCRWLFTKAYKWMSDEKITIFKEIKKFTLNKKKDIDEYKKIRE